VARGDNFLVYEKHLEDGSIAVGLFNTGSAGSVNVTAKWSDLGITGQHSVRDLWRQKDLGRFADSFSISVSSRSAELVKIQ
jgi:alpha-galactosidase